MTAKILIVEDEEKRDITSKKAWKKPGFPHSG